MLIFLQRPLSDVSSKCTSNDIDPNNENRIVLCSAKDKFVLGQDICVMCGSLGTDQEACLISCSQCGQCYHPFCVNVKVSYNDNNFIFCEFYFHILITGY